MDLGAAGDVSVSDDLGYTESGNYFRIWKKEKGAWKVLFDLTNPVPLETDKN